MQMIWRWSHLQPHQMLLTDLQVELLHINSWCLSNNMIINGAKTKCMLFCGCKTRCEEADNITLNGSVLEYVCTFKLLGVTIANDLRWNHHVDIQSKAAIRQTFAILKLKRAGISTDLLWRVYFTFIRSILTYGFVSYCNLPEYLMCKIIKVENRVKQLIGSSPQVNLRDFCDHICTKMVKAAIQNDKHPIQKLFMLNPSQRNNRHTTKFIAPRCKTSRRQNSILKYLWLLCIKLLIVILNNAFGC